jgi:hypothetical protein
MSLEKPLIYVILGAAGSGRREVVADLIEGGLAEGSRAAVLLSTGETPAESDARLGDIVRWTWHDGLIGAQLPEGATHVFFVTDGRVNPVDQLEQLHTWITAVGGEIGRVLTIVSCRLAERHTALLPWYEACIHFSDIVLLHQREGVANKWLSDFQSHFKDQFYPCLFEMVKAGRVKNPLVVLEPQARRMSHLFDIDEWTGLDLEGVEFGTEDEDEDEDGAKPAKAKGKNKSADEDDEDDWKPEVDPYLQRRTGGRREKEIPDVAKYLAS